MLINCNLLSNGRLKAANDDLKAYTKAINDMKKDLDYIFRKIRTIKTKVNTQYPAAAKVVEQKLKVHTLCEEAEEGEQSETKAEELTSEQKQQPSRSSGKKSRTSSKDDSSVGYVKMEQSPEKNDNGEQQRKSFDESTDNESSDCTTDT